MFSLLQVFIGLTTLYWPLQYDSVTAEFDLRNFLENLQIRF